MLDPGERTPGVRPASATKADSPSRGRRDEVVTAATAEASPSAVMLASAMAAKSVVSMIVRDAKAVETRRRADAVPLEPTARSAARRLPLGRSREHPQSGSGR